MKMIDTNEKKYIEIRDVIDAFRERCWQLYKRPYSKADIAEIFLKYGNVKNEYVYLFSGKRNTYDMCARVTIPDVVKKLLEKITKGKSPRSPCFFWSTHWVNGQVELIERKLDLELAKSIEIRQQSVKSIITKSVKVNEKTNDLAEEVPKFANLILAMVWLKSTQGSTAYRKADGQPNDSTIAKKWAEEIENMAKHSLKDFKIRGYSEENIRKLIAKARNYATKEFNTIK